MDGSSVLVGLDLDDTLYKEVDFIMSGYRAVDAVLEKDYGYKGAFKVMADAYKQGANAFEQVVKAVNNPKVTNEFVQDIYWNHIPDIHLDKLTYSTLKDLKGNGYKLVLITDGRSVAQRNKIKALGLDEFVADDDIFISEETGTDKTQAATFKTVHDKYPDMDARFYIGDNTQKDFFWANRLAWTTICVEDNGKNRHKQKFDGDRMHLPTYVITYFYESLEFILE